MLKDSQDQSRNSSVMAIQLWLLPQLGDVPVVCVERATAAIPGLHRKELFGGGEALSPPTRQVHV